MDAIGPGFLIADRLQADGHRVIRYNGTERAMQENTYYNKRTESFFNLRRALKELKLPNNEDLREELETIKFYTTQIGLLALESKKLIIKRLGRSPDYADTLSMLCSEGIPSELKKRDKKKTEGDEFVQMLRRGRISNPKPDPYSITIGSDIFEGDFYKKDD